MTGLDKIISKINSDTELRCAEIIASAQKQCDKIQATAKQESDRIAAEIESAAKEEAANIIKVANSGAAQQSRQTVLAAKVEAVNETLSKLIKALITLPDDEYFAAVIKIAGENAMAGECTASMSRKDNSRLPSDFASKLDKVLSEKGCKATLVSEPADINSGILLDYGNICINCSFEAVVEENSDIYKSKISEIIFQAVN